jgi:hypothetical protein
MAESATIMAEEMQPEKKVAFANRKYTNEEKRKMEEEELEQLLKEQRGEVEQEAAEPEEEEPTSAEEKTFKKRYSDLRRHQQKQAEEFKAELDALKRQLSEATKKEMKLPKSDEDIEQWASEYPDVAAIVETIAMKKAREQSSALKNASKQLMRCNLVQLKKKLKQNLCVCILTLMKFVTVTTFILGQKTSLNGYRMHCTKMTMTHVLPHEQLTCTKLTWELLPRKLQQIRMQLSLFLQRTVVVSHRKMNPLLI